MKPHKALPPKLPLNKIVFLAAVLELNILSSGQVFAAPSDLLINELMYDAKGSDDKHEWIELYNQGINSVTIITGAGAGSWRLNDGSNHTFTLFQGPLVIAPGGYAILADNPAMFLLDYPGFAGTIFKVSMSLNNTQDTLKLSSDKGSTFFGEITYTKTLGAAGNGRTLEREDSTLRESYVDKGTPGQTNSTPPPPPSPVVYSDSVFINEVYPNPKTDEQEFIELYNSSAGSVDLSGWQIDDFLDGGSSPHTIANGTAIIAQGYLTLYDTVGLNNDGDWAWFFAPNGTEKSSMQYTSSIKGRSWAKKSDNTFALTRIVTANTANQFSEASTSTDIVINEIVPDPTSGSADEMIELRNLSDTPVDLTDWLLDDIEGGSPAYTIPENTLIQGRGYWIFYNSTTGIGLNNDGDSVRLMWADKTITSSVVYSNSRVGDSYSRNNDSIFEWTPIITPGSPNQFPPPVTSKPVISPPEPASPPQSNIQQISIPENPITPIPQTPLIQPPINLLTLPVLPTIQNKQSSGLPTDTKPNAMIPQATVTLSTLFAGLTGFHQWLKKRKR